MPMLSKQQVVFLEDVEKIEKLGEKNRDATVEQLEEYIKPVGGGYFFVLPGVRSKDDFFAEALLRAAA